MRFLTLSSADANTTADVRKNNFSSERGLVAGEIVAQNLGKSVVHQHALQLPAIR